MNVERDDKELDLGVYSQSSKIDGEIFINIFWWNDSGKKSLWVSETDLEKASTDNSSAE